MLTTIVSSFVFFLEGVSIDTYSFVQLSQEVDLISQRIHLGIQIYLIHVGSINVLQSQFENQVRLKR